MLIQCSLVSCLSSPPSPEGEGIGGGRNTGRVPGEKEGMGGGLPPGPPFRVRFEQDKHQPVPPLPVTDFSPLTFATTRNSAHPIAQMRKPRLREKHRAPG